MRGEKRSRISGLTYFHSCRKHLPREIDIRMDLLRNDHFRSSNEGADTEQRTLATSSAISINGLNFVIRPLKDVTSCCSFVRISELLVKALDTLETRGCGSLFANVWTCFSASPVIADVESCVIRTDSLVGLGFPFLSTKDRTTSKLSSFQH